ncbi:MAG TPA: L,D-transpeptidase family protein [Pyrinomonadaceae bacterium]|jgi:hypothetical protein|nr:L,D-transpeptidase family protein [Pyrinomonadaceae bacterium]
MSQDFQAVIQAIQILKFLPEMERPEYYDSVIAPLIESIAASIQPQNPQSIIEWLQIQSFALNFAVEGITEVTYELNSRFPQELQEALALLPPEQQVRIQWLLREFAGQENLPPEIVERNAAITSRVLDNLAENLRDTPRSATGILGEFVGTSTFQSTRGFPVVHGTFKLFAQDGSEINTYTVNTGGGGKNFQKTNGPVPPGIYTVSHHLANRDTRGMVLNGVGYSFHLLPTDETQVFGRSLFRIHPDGNPLGTNGCLGVREDAARLRDCENQIAGLLQSVGIFKVSVRY